MKPAKHKKIWIDLDNSPHVPLFKPIIDELGHRGYDCMVTSRDCFQVAGLVDLYGLKCKTIGKHYGKNTLMKLFGLVYRGLQLTPSAIKEKPALALSHGSRSQQLVSRMLGIPNIIMNDYEYVRFLPFNDTSWLITPEYIHGWSEKIDPSHISTYSGLKEDVYVPEFVARSVHLEGTGTERGPPDHHRAPPRKRGPLSQPRGRQALRGGHGSLRGHGEDHPGHPAPQRPPGRGDPGKMAASSSKQGKPSSPTTSSTD